MLSSKLRTLSHTATMAAALLGLSTVNGALSDANRLTYLDQSDPWDVNQSFPKLVTPQWIGEQDVEAVITLGIDDMTDPRRWEKFLRPILDRLNQRLGRAPVSIFTRKVDPADPQLQRWLDEGLSLETHTASHPCPLLQKGDFLAAKTTYDECIDLLSQVPGNRPVAFRVPCSDVYNSPSPRFYEEIFKRTTPHGRFVTIDSSIFNVFTAEDAELPKALVIDESGRERFLKYDQQTNYHCVNRIFNYPYPFVVSGLCWELPPVLPSDSLAQRYHRPFNPQIVRDYQAALDATVLKKGAFNLCFHPHGWISADQIIELIEYAVQRHGRRIAFLNFREVEERLTRNLLAGQPLRASNGQDNGVRLIDLNKDGYMDVVVGNEKMRRTRLWQPNERRWLDLEFPAPLVRISETGERTGAGNQFGIVEGGPVLMMRSEDRTGAWQFDGHQWQPAPALWNGLELNGSAVLTQQHGRDGGVRLRDINKDGICELVVGNETQNAVFTWIAEAKSWSRLSYGLPANTAIVDRSGQDAGLRFVDLNEDGYEDVVFSNAERYSVHLFIPAPNVLRAFTEVGWTRPVTIGRRGDPGEIPMIVRSGPYRNNGAWFSSRGLWIQNEETSSMTNHVDHRSFHELMVGYLPPPLSPKESMAAFDLLPGFEIELVAAEPLVRDPVNFEWGADGKLWVVEMGDYPMGLDGKDKPGGRITYLEDLDQDGRYDRATVFLDQLRFPKGVLPWRKGALVAAAPEVFYAEDTDGDGRADRREVLLQGFLTFNPQHEVNGFIYGLDNWVYGSGSSGGGTVHCLKTGRQLKIDGRDFRFRPDDGSFQAQAGPTQYGRGRDDWGHGFGLNSGSWGWHYYLPLHYAERNPLLIIPTTRRPLANYPNANRLYRISRLMARPQRGYAIDYVVAANCVSPYRDELFGQEFSHSYFVSEADKNLVHREVLEPDGVSFRSRRSDQELNREFLASADNWFRPTMTKTGPDGALYIADMYRLIIEWGGWYPPDVQPLLDFRAGHDRGRIYRVYPKGAQLRPIPRLDQLNTANLVAALESPNGWQRDTAQRLLVHAADPSAVPHLKALVRKSPRAKTRMQALCTLEGIAGLTPEILTSALKDAHSRVREQAMRASESLLRDYAPARLPHDHNYAGDRSRAREGVAQDRFVGSDPQPRPHGSGYDSWLQTLLQKTEDPDLRVRYQLAFTLGEWHDPKAGKALAQLALKDGEHPDMRVAILSSAVPHLDIIVSSLFPPRDEPSLSAELLEELMESVTILSPTNALATALNRITDLKGPSPAFWQMTALAGFLDALERRNISLNQYHQILPDLRSPIEKTERLFTQTRRIVASSHSNHIDRIAAIRLLGRGLTQKQEDLQILSRLLQPESSEPAQKAALETLARIGEPVVAGILLDHWSQYGPNQRLQVLDVLMSRLEWMDPLLERIESGQIARSQIGPAHRQKLLTHNSDPIRKTSQRLFTGPEPDRLKILAAYRQVTQLNGNPIAGHRLFVDNCASCHRFRSQGKAIGPDLDALADKPIAWLLSAILDPNESVEPAYLQYSVVTRSGREFSGIITDETANSLTMKSADGTEPQFLRSEIQELRALQLSLMPEGLEVQLNAQAMANLIAYLKGTPLLEP